ncbi:MAG: hypothetical protein A3K19_22785 [Lentisphaerae bacterium RIFOXYB12_FULL_65_16]|nr:MAG: hypothetical protein A3K18_16970 [Lentisphaerae bacterium RIFOXYA12_64_32]OGV90037.1 MAG: hypothetical protein A3K19_22785 [Lentisphaerae bacterium RIFOXYB12_FULL_65_16]
MTLDELKPIVIPFCEQFAVRRLDVFGSVARAEATSTRDVDLVVEFKDPGRGLSRRFFGFLHSLEDNLGCRVDLLTLDGLRNPYFRCRVLAERILINEG